MKFKITPETKAFAAYLASGGRNEWATGETYDSTLDELLDWLRQNPGKYTIDLSGVNMVIVADKERMTLICDSREDDRLLTVELMKKLSPSASA